VSRVRNMFHEERLIWWLLVVATVIRIAALVDKGVYFDPNFSDAAGYLESARVLASTGRLGFYGYEHSAYVMPGFVLFLTLFNLATPNVFLQYLAIKASMILMSAASIYVLYLIGKRIGGTRVGLIAAALFTLSMPQIYTGTLALSENPFTLSVLGLTLFVIRLADKPSWRVFGWCLVILVTAVFIKQAAIGLLPPVLVYLLVRRYPTSLLAKQVVLTVVILALSLSPWWARNYRVFGEFVPFTSMSAATVLHGSYQRFQPYRTGSAEAVDELIGRSTESEVEQNRALAEAASVRMSNQWDANPVDMLFTYLS